MRGVLSIAGIKSIMAILLITLGISEISAQKVALKTNLLSDATANVSLGGEVVVTPRWSIDLAWQLNNWSFDNGKRWKHWFVQPEARYWLCDAFNGHFFGMHLIGGKYNVGHIDIPLNFLGSNFKLLKDNRYQGWGAGSGIAYGYSWPLAKHWNFEAEIGLGYIFTRFDRFECAGCGRKVESDRTHHYFGPTKVALNLVYIF